jgi:hypothetical protein
MAPPDRSPVDAEASRDGVLVSPSDDNELPFLPRWLWVGAGGDLTVVMVNGTTLTLANVPPGTLLRMRVSKVKADGTTAGSIVAFD